MIFLYYLSSIPGKELVPLPYGADKVIHFSLYLLLGVFLTGALPEKKIWAIIIGTIYGVLDELHQSFIPYRSCSFYDWLADAAGVIVGIYLWIIWEKIKKKD